MLSVKPRKKSAIEKIEAINGGVILSSERGMLRLMPQNPKCVRVTYTERENFGTHKGMGITYTGTYKDWCYHETETTLSLTTEAMCVEVNKQYGSIRYFNQVGECVLSEKERDCRELESFEAYCTVVDEKTQVEEIDTPDGKKTQIKQASKVFDKQLYHTKLHMAWQEDEVLYGLGQAEEGVLNLRGQTVYVHQANMKIGIPFFVSTKGYGFLSGTDSTAIFEDTAHGSFFYTEADEAMDYYIILGDTLDEIIGGYRQMTGKASMLPSWAYGFIQSQERYEDAEEILAVAEAFRTRQIGVDGLVLDWRSWKGEEWGQKTFDEERFKEPQKMIEVLHEKEIHFMISIWPNMNKGTANHRAFETIGGLFSGSTTYDVFSDKARALYWQQAYDGLFTKGVDAWWCDSCEPVAPEWTKQTCPQAGKLYNEYVERAGALMPYDKINAYPLAHARTMYEGQRSCCDTKRVTNLTRSTHSGGQRYGTILWSGDISATWEVFKKQIVAGLNFCATGLPYWTLDIGAFFVKKGEKWFWNGDYDKGTDDKGYQELFTRWYQYGAFLPIFRSHGTDVRREMWLVDKEEGIFYQAMVKANRLRYTLLPYIYSYAFEVWKDDRTMMRLLAFDFKKDKTVYTIDDQYMFGGSMMVCPVTKPMYYDVDSKPIQDCPRTRKVYFPKGCAWYDYATQERIEGGTTKEVVATIERMPLYVKEGSILVTAKGLQSSKGLEGVEKYYVIYGNQDCETLYYSDKGDGYGYEQGDYKTDVLRWHHEQGVLYKNDEVVEAKYVRHIK